MVFAENEPIISAVSAEFMMYTWEQQDWPAFTWSKQSLAATLNQAHTAHGRLLGNMEALGFLQRGEANLRALTEDVIRSSAIEDESLDLHQVRSSIARRLGMDVAGLVPSSHHVDGVVQMMLDATVDFDEPLTKARLFAWHAALFPTGRSGMHKLIMGDWCGTPATSTEGAKHPCSAKQGALKTDANSLGTSFLEDWRDDHDGPIQVISGPHARLRVHYEAPPAACVPSEMQKFLTWFENSSELDPFVKAGLAHLWFVTIHPFEDGNGRIARAIADMSLARAADSSKRFYSMSAQILLERKQYYGQLESTQKSDVDVTQWLSWFLDCLVRSIGSARMTLKSVLQKAQFWQHFSQAQFNKRQVAILNRLLDGFDGNMTTSKWAKIAKCSQDTAHRDILALIEQGVMKKDTAGGRSTSYSLCDT